MVLIGLLWGAGVGLGVWLCVRALAPRAQPIPDVLAAMSRPGRSFSESVTGTRPSLVQRAESISAQLLAHLGLTAGDTAALRVVGTSPSRHALDKVVAALAGLLGITAIGVAADAAGVGPPAGMVGLLAIAAGIIGFVYPDLALREEAARRRKAFRHALSAYLDLVNILLAGGAGIETALYAAADAGDGWVFERLRQALDVARRTGASPWAALAELGRGVGVGELTELAANVSLAGSHGARIRASLAAKADALRGHQVAETEATAESATERMTIPLAVLLFGFLILIAYPAMTQITTVSS